MTIGDSLITMPVAASSSSSSGFTIGDAIIVFVLVIAAFTLIAALIARRPPGRLAYRPRVRSERARRVREAAEEDIETIEEDPGFVERRDVPGSREDDL
jgi:hypothetical protein